MNDLPPDMVYQLEKEGLSLSKAPGVDYQYVGFNMRDSVLKDVRVRQAIGHAIDRQAIVDYLRRGLATVADGMLPPTNWAYEPDVLVLDYDPERAKALLDEAGYPRSRRRRSAAASVAVATRPPAPNSHGCRRPSSSRICAPSASRSTCDRTSSRRCMRTSSRAISRCTRCSGSAAHWPIPTFFGACFTRNRCRPADSTAVISAIRKSIALIDEASKATDYETRRQLYGRVQQLLADAAPYISLWHRTNFALAQPELEGIRLTPQGDFTFLRNVSR